MMAEMNGTYEPGEWDWVNNQVATYEASGGTEGNTLFDTGIPVIIVTMLGAKSGKLRKIALMRVEHDGEYALIASKGGFPTNPEWYHNLVAHPDQVMIQDGPEPFAVEVEQVYGEERSEWYERGAAVYPPYHEYQAATDRLIPVFVARRR